jgi:hypothetical protein
MHYHSGQGLRGYRLLSKLNARNISCAVGDGAMESEIYQYLVNTYAKTVVQA